MKLMKEQEKYIWELLKIANNEFVPSLSSRNSTTQENLIGTENIDNNEPLFYFEELKKQDILIFSNEEQVLGFMSYIPNRIFRFPNENIKRKVTYVSTVIVHPKARGNGLTEKFYKDLINMSENPIVTRTWNTNKTHIHILEKMGFKLALRLKDDRGKDIDTVYYIRNN